MAPPSTLHKVVPLSALEALRSGFYLALSRLYYLVIRLVYIFLLVQLIGVEKYGYFSYAANWYVLLLPLAMWGGNELLISRLAKITAMQQAEFAGTSLSLRLVFAGLGTMLIAVSALFLETESQLQQLMLIFSQGIMLRGLLGWYTSMYAARGQSALWFRLHMLFTTLEVVLVLVLASLGSSLLGLAVAQSCIWWITLLVVVQHQGRHFGPLGLCWNVGVVRWLVTRGAALGLANFFLLCMIPGLLLLYRYLGPELATLGALALVLQVFQIADGLVRIVSNALLPALRNSSQDERRKLLTFSACGCLLATLAGGVAAGALMIAKASLLAYAPLQRFHSALALLADFAWVLMPLLSLHVLRLALITLDAVPSYLIAVLSGVCAVGVTLLVAHLGAGIDAEAVLRSMGVGFTVTALCELFFILATGRSVRSPAPGADEVPI